MAAVTLLETRGLSRRFGGLQAVSDVAFRLDEGEVRAIIGPNGAGKTTFVSMISGRVRPTGGTIAFQGRDITALRPWERVMRGIVYTFQVTSIYRALSCYENVALAAQRRLMHGLLARVTLREGRIAQRVEAALGAVGLQAVMHRPADTLPYGHQRLLEVAMGLALEPRLLILDEPERGLAPDEITAFCALVRRIAQDATILIIEHNMSVVLELAQRITVMERGTLLAEGTPAEIEAHPDVQRAYLGRMMLAVERINGFYGGVQVLRDVSFRVAPGEVVGLLGRNGAGKTTVMKALMGLVRVRCGSIALDGAELTRLPAHEIPRRGLAYVPQGRRLFAGLSVEENLRMGLLVRDVPADTRARVLSLFPVLTERLGQRAGTLSGGEQQMLATARALCLQPQLLLLDEPSEGLMPSVIETLLATVLRLKAQGVAVLLVEQKVEAALKVCDRLLFLENGTLRHEATPAALAADPSPLERYVGIRR